MKKKLSLMNSSDAIAIMNNPNCKSMKPISMQEIQVPKTVLARAPKY
jgi:hypothetical protein